MLADSQSSDDVSEAHGAQKILPGNGWIVGGAGNGDILFTLFDRMVDDQATIDPTTVKQYLIDFVDNSLTDSARREISLYAATEDTLLLFRPGTYRQPQPRDGFLTIGSGAEFVYRARSRNYVLGISNPTESLADTFASVEGSLDAANESLTVDDQLMLGLIVGGRTYMVGDRDVSPTYAPPAIQKNWSAAAQRFGVIRGLAQSHRGELREAQRNLSAIAVGQLSTRQLGAIADSNDAIKRLREQLLTALMELMGWYDGLLGRPSAPPTII